MTRTVPVVVPLLAGGVSRQPQHRRFPDQVQSADNVMFSLVDGCSKRNGTRYVKKLATLTAGRDYRMHAIRRDDNEKYLVVTWAGSGSAELKVYDTNGVSASLTDAESLVSTYLAAGSATSIDLRLTTAADTTLIANRRATPAASASANYSVVGEVRDYDVLISYAAPFVTENQYVRVRDDTVAHPAGYWQYQSAFGFAYATFAEMTTAQFATHDSSIGYQLASLNPAGFVIDFRKQTISGTAATWDGTTQRLTKSLAFGSYTHEVGDKLYVSSGTGWTPGYYTIVAKISANELELSGGPAGTNVPTYTHIGASFSVTVDFTIEPVTDMYNVAKVIERALRRAGATRACVNWTRTFNASNAAGRFRIVSPWGGTEATILGVTAPSGIYDYTAVNRPFNGFVATAGTGSTMGATSDPVDRWKRVAAPNQAGDVPTVTTLPIRLQRTSTGPLAFTLSSAPWNPRTSGDENSNPSPPMLTDGYGVSDLCFMDNRLFFLSGEAVASSQAGDFYNLFRQDAFTLTDADPVRLKATTPAVALGDFLTPIPQLQSMLVTTRGPVQLLVTGGDPGFTPTDAAINVSTSKQTKSGVRPVLMDTAIYFPTVQGNSTDIYEYRAGDRIVPTDAALVTLHVPGYIPTGVTRLSACDNLGLLTALAGNAIYVYRTRYVNGEKVHSAWSRFTFDASVSVLDIAVIDTELYLLTYRAATGFHLERLSLGDYAEGDSFPWLVHLDSVYAFNTGTFGSGNTTWTLPDSASDSTINALVAEDGRCYAVTTSSGTVTLTGVNLSAVKVRIGRTFGALVTLSRVFPQGSQGTNSLDNSVQHRSLTVYASASGDFTLTLSSTQADPKTETQTTANGSAPTIRDREVRMETGGQTDTITLALSSTNAHPVTWSGLHHAIDVSERSGVKQ